MGKNTPHRRLEMAIYSENLILRFKGSSRGRAAKLNTKLLYLQCVERLWIAFLFAFCQKDSRGRKHT